MDYTQHRLYKKISDPVRIMGLTFDELGVGLGCFALSVLSQSIFWNVIFFLMAPLSVLGMKKFKKVGAGGNLHAFLYWQGLSPKPFDSFPDFHERIWLS